MIAAENHQAERTFLQYILHDGFMPDLYPRRIEPDLSIGRDRVGRIERLFILQGKEILDLAADEQPSRRPKLHHLESVALQQVEDVQFEELSFGIGGLSLGE